MIRCENLHVTFNPGLPTEKLALRGIDLTIPSGEFVTVIGSNGAGKSTLLNTIAGDIESTKGRIFFSERDVTNIPATGRTKDIARVFQDPLAGTCGNLTVEENMSLAYGRGQKGTLAFVIRWTASIGQSSNVSITTKQYFTFRRAYCCIRSKNSRFNHGYFLADNQRKTTDCYDGNSLHAPSA